MQRRELFGSYNIIFFLMQTLRLNETLFCVVALQQDESLSGSLIDDVTPEMWCYKMFCLLVVMGTDSELGHDQSGSDTSKFFGSKYNI